MPPKILLVTGSAPPDACGVGDYTASLASALQRAGQAVEVLCHRDWSIAGTSKAVRILLAESNSIIHMQYPTMGYRYSLGPQLGMIVKRGVVTIHEFSLAHPLRKLSLIPFTLRSRRLVMTSEFERDEMAKKMPWARNKMRIIPIGSNIGSFPEVLKVREESVVYFGLIMPRKGLEAFIEFARLVRSRGLKWDLSIIGKIAPGKEDYARGLMDSARSLGVRCVLDASAESVSDQLSRAGLGYLPFPDGASDRRGSLKAALVVGLPCITTQSEQTSRDLAQILTFAQTPSAAVEKAIALMGSLDERERLSRLARDFSSQFTWERIALMHQRMYQELSGTF